MVERPNTARGEAVCCIEGSRPRSSSALFRVQHVYSVLLLVYCILGGRKWKRLAYRFDCAMSGSDRLTRHYTCEYSEYYSLERAYCPCLAITAEKTALRSVLRSRAINTERGGTFDAITCWQYGTGARHCSIQKLCCMMNTARASPLMRPRKIQ